MTINQTDCSVASMLFSVVVDVDVVATVVSIASVVFAEIIIFNDKV